VAISESERLDMHLKLKDVLGEQVANTMINHLPPSGWTDVARKSDMDQRFDFVDQRFDIIDQRFRGITAALWAIAGLYTTTTIGLYTLIATKL
jgi:hypothetical protein